MPVVAVVAGVASAASGIAAFGAATGLAAVSAGLAVVGGVATALGGLTGNKKLMKFGMIAGLGGAAISGISSLANSGAKSATSLSLGDSGLGLSAKAAGEGLQAADTGLLGLGNKAAETAGGSFASGLNESLSTVNAIDTGSASLAASLPQGYAPPVSAATTALADYRLAPPKVGIPQSSFAPSASDLMAGATERSTMTPGLDSPSSAFSDFGQWLSKNKELAKVGSGMLTSLGQAYMAEQQQKYAERMSERQRERINSSIINQYQSF